MTDVYVNNVKCTLVNCPHCGNGYHSPFYNEEREIECKCGKTFKYKTVKKPEFLTTVYKEGSK